MKIAVPKMKLNWKKRERDDDDDLKTVFKEYLWTFVDNLLTFLIQPYSQISIIIITQRSSAGESYVGIWRIMAVSLMIYASNHVFF